MAKRQALRSLRNGKIFPMNPDMARADDVEMVYIGDDGKVIEPEEVGPAAAMDLPDPEKESEKEPEPDSGKEPEKGPEEPEKAAAKSEASATARRKRS